MPDFKQNEYRTPEDRLELAKAKSTYFEPSVQALAHDVMALDALCHRLYKALKSKEKDIRASAMHAYEELYDC